MAEKNTHSILETIKKKMQKLDQKSEVKKTFSLVEMGESIKNFNIRTVEALAERSKTNAEQLNRIFKNFDTTPGKFMKTVKLDFAK